MKTFTQLMSKEISICRTTKMCKCSKYLQRALTLGGNKIKNKAFKKHLIEAMTNTEQKN